jgi:hypothetical protein
VACRSWVLVGPSVHAFPVGLYPVVYAVVFVEFLEEESGPADVVMFSECLVDAFDGVSAAVIGDVINFHDFAEEVFVFGAPVGEGGIFVSVRLRRVSGRQCSALGLKEGLKRRPSSG